MDLASPSADHSIIRKRLRRAVLVAELTEQHVWFWVYHHAGQASKNNTLCSCGMCRDEKYRDKPRRKQWLEL